MEHQHNDSDPNHLPEQSPEAALLAKEKYRREFNKGMTCLAIGLLVMALSFAVNLLLYNFNGDFRFVMYATTILGSALILFGIGCIMGF